MAKFLFTMWPANDLGLPSRLVPIARRLADRGNEVAMCNPSPAPASLIAEAGLRNLPMPEPAVAPPMIDLNEAAQAWDAEHLLAPCYMDEIYVEGMTAAYVKLMREYAPDVVVDSFEQLACLAGRIVNVPVATVLQASFHPSSGGFYWWKKERPARLPSAADVVNRVAAKYGVAPEARCVDRVAGDYCLIVGTPETDPLPSSARVEYIGPMVWQSANAVLPEWVNALGRERPLIWVYSGNPRYAGNVATAIDSIVVIRAAIAALGGTAVDVVLTTGYQQLPSELGELPENFRHASYVPGLLMAGRCDLMVHHGGHGSVMTGLLAGTPAVIVPTISEREGNARRVASLGAAEVVTPSAGADGEKHVHVEEFEAKVKQVLEDRGYRESATRVADSMRKYGGLTGAVEKLEKFARTAVSK